MTMLTWLIELFRALRDYWRVDLVLADDVFEEWREVIG